MLVINAVTQNPNRSPPTPEFVWQQANSFGMHFPQVLDTSRSIYRYANSSRIGLPFAVAIDLRSMKVAYSKQGRTGVAQIESFAQQLLGPKK